MDNNQNLTDSITNNLNQEIAAIALCLKDSPAYVMHRSSSKAGAASTTRSDRKNLWAV